MLQLHVVVVVVDDDDDVPSSQMNRQKRGKSCRGAMQSLVRYVGSGRCIQGLL